GWNPWDREPPRPPRPYVVDDVSELEVLLWGRPIRVDPKIGPRPAPPPRPAGRRRGIRARSVLDSAGPAGQGIYADLIVGPVMQRTQAAPATAVGRVRLRAGPPHSQTRLRVGETESRRTMYPDLRVRVPHAQQIPQAPRGSPPCPPRTPRAAP